MSRRPCRHALEATHRLALDGPEAIESAALAADWRAGGDHAAAGLCERDAAASFRAAWSHAARCWQGPCPCPCP